MTPSQNSYTLNVSTTIIPYTSTYNTNTTFFTTIDCPHCINDLPAVQGIVWTIIAIGWILCIPMTIYFLKFYRQRRNVMIHKRYATCTLVMYVVIMLDTIFVRPAWLTLEAGVFPDRGGWFRFRMWLTLTTYSFTYFGFSGCILWRAWMLFYDINYSKQSQNGEWKNLIAPQSPNNITATKGALVHQWFLTHIHNFGNFRWVTVRLTALTAFLMCISYFLWIYGYCLLMYKKNKSTDDVADYYNILITAQFYDFFVNVLIAIVLLILARKIPLFYDHFFVREELRLLFICAAIYYSAVIVFFILLIVFNVVTVALQDYEKIAVVATVFTMVHGLFATIAQFAIILVQTAWVLHKIRPYLLLQTRLLHKSVSKLQMTELNAAAKELDEENYAEQAIKQHQKQQKRSANSIGSNHSNASSYRQMQYEFTVNDLIEHSMGFDGFMIHLIREFSMECLLSYVEFTQFLGAIYQKCDDIENEEQLYIPNYPSSVPYSYIIEQNEWFTAPEHNDEDSRMSQRSSKRLNVNAFSIKRPQKTDSRKNPSLDFSQLTEADREKYNFKVRFQILSIGNALYHKYVRPGGELEINISGPLRKQFYETFENKKWMKDGEKHVVDAQKICNLYSKAAIEVYKLLKISFDRFRDKQDYDRLKKRCMADRERSSVKSKEELRSMSPEETFD